MRVLLHLIRKYLILFTYLGIYWSSLVLSFKIALLTLQEDIFWNTFILIIIAAGIIFLTSHFIKKDLLKQFGEMNRSIRIILRFSLSFSLAFYVSTFLKGGLSLVWDSLSSSISSYKDVTIVMIVAPFYLLIMAFFIFAPIFILLKLITSDSVYAKTFVVFVYLIIWALYLYFVLIKGASQNWDELSLGLFMPITKFVLGFLPIGWFYQLFVKDSDFTERMEPFNFRSRNY